MFDVETQMNNLLNFLKNNSIYEYSDEDKVEFDAFDPNQLSHKLEGHTNVKPTFLKKLNNNFRNIFGFKPKYISDITKVRDDYYSSFDIDFLKVTKNIWDFEFSFKNSKLMLDKSTKNKDFIQIIISTDKMIKYIKLINYEVVEEYIFDSVVEWNMSLSHPACEDLTYIFVNQKSIPFASNCFLYAENYKNYIPFDGKKLNESTIFIINYINDIFFKNKLTVEYDSILEDIFDKVKESSNKPLNEWKDEELFYFKLKYCN